MPALSTGNCALARLTGRLVSVLVLLWLWPAGAAAQPVSGPAGNATWEFHVAATEDVLWLAGSRGGQSMLARRTAAKPFGQLRTASSRVAAMATVDGSAFVFFEEEWFYRYDEDGELTQTRLPDRGIPVHMVGLGSELYALVHSSTAMAMPAARTAETEPATAPAFDPGDAPLSMVRYDGKQWYAVAACPTGVRPDRAHRLRPRLCPANGKLLLFWVADEARRIHRAALDLAAATWSAGEPIDAAGLTGFWAVVVNVVPTLVVATEQAAGGEAISVYRLIGGRVGVESPPPRRIEPRLSPLPEGVALTRYIDAFGFNQHLGLLGTDPAGAAYVRFARVGAAPIEPTVRVEDVFSEPAAAQRTQASLQMLVLLIMLVVLGSLFVFRRGSMVKPAPLPPGHTLALKLQRLGGWAVDFIPFGWSAAIILEIEWLEGLRQLAAWAFVSGFDAGHPPQKVLMWWGLSCGGHVAYMLVMELVAHRTVGKVLTGTRLLSETGTPPAFWQILVRNLLRLLELMPQFWILVLLILLSRNRQRLGDIFGRTVVVRRIAAPEPPADQGGQSSGDHEHPPEPPASPPENP